MASTSFLLAIQGGRGIITLEVTPEETYFNLLGYVCLGYTATFTVTTSSQSNEWEAIPSDSWITVQNGSGTGDGSFSVVVSKAVVERSGTITVQSSASVDPIIDVYQVQTCPE